MSDVCPACGSPIGPGDYRCEGERNGVRCGKDLVEDTGSTGRWSA